MKVLIATGGTGGHIFPALALADDLIKKNPKNEIVFIGTKYRLEKDIIPSKGYRFIGLDISSTSGKLSKKVKAVIKLISAYFQCKRIIKAEKADICIGFGNYISIPLIKAASKLKIKTIIHEQNSYAGKANIYLSKYVDVVIGCYKENIKQFECDNIKILGNPRSSAALLVKKDKNVLVELGLKADLKTVLIVMGSLGSDSVNKIMKDALKEMANNDYQILFVVGKNTSEDYLQCLDCSEHIVTKDFIDGIEVMANVDLIVSRAGATTLSEITALKLPAIIIPSPYVPNNHQLLNAKVLSDAEAAVLIEEKDLNVTSLVKAINDLINDVQKLKKMSEKMNKFAYVNASSDIINTIETLVGKVDE
jgi:UDP-N-acetylglucosamine--N-acetylmuramyl-(pentapeptide) pyrophosphoryl-undecaprenol N-acetylglucosamine transferase